MPIPHISNTQLSKLIEQPVQFRDGQIIKGKITKLFPHQKAEIQVGQQKIIAEVEAPLSTGKKYLFQVQYVKGEAIHLRVIGDVSKQNSTQHFIQLLQQMDVKITRNHLHFIQQLVNENIPFDQTQLRQVIQLLKDIDYHQQYDPIIKQMLSNNLPITKDVLQALLIYKTHTLSSLMKNVYVDLKNLSSLTGDQQKLKSLLRHYLLPSSQWNNFVQRSDNIIGFQLLGLIEHKANKTMEPPFLNAIPKGKEVNIQAFVEQEGSIQRIAKHLMKMFHSNKGLTKEQFLEMEKLLTTDLIPRLPEDQQQVVLSLSKNLSNVNEQKLYTILQTLSNNDAYLLLHELLSQTSTDMQQRTSPLQMMFLSYLKRFIQQIGMTNESIIRNASRLSLTNNENELLTSIRQTIKSQLIQIIGENGQKNEKMQQLLHFINGMQLHSVKETNNYVQASFHLPGAKFFLKEDIKMKLEGKRKQDGKIDADYCHILFFLSLKNIEETVIDMHIQKRIISLTIYNSYSDTLGNQMHHLEEKLQEQLHQLDYYLSNVKWRVLEEREDDHRKADEILQQERIDFFI